MIFLEDVFLFSHPKAGRTWVRIMLARLSELMGGNPKKKELIRYRHSQPYFWGEEIKTKNRRIIILVRDPRDIVVSYYFEVTLRDWSKKYNFQGTMPEFLRNKRFGIDSIINFYNYWFKKLGDHPSSMFLAYEDMKKNCFNELERMCRFLEISPSQLMLKDAIQYSSFENMREIELGRKENILSSKGGFTMQETNPEAFKVRQGRVGGYVNYLNTEDIAYINNRMKRLNPNYGYGVN